MKIKLYLTIIFVLLVVGSCEDDPKIDITVKNDCQWTIEVNITKSTSLPAYHSIAPGGTRKFGSLENTNYYIHVTASAASGTPAAAQNNFYEKMNVYKFDTWTLSWTGSAYKITYH
ncbi:MAG: hypothetical protein FWG99_11275 [Treponema sp.]|nr:hypothetical protein [Treponema sp.]